MADLGKSAGDGKTSPFGDGGGKQGGGGSVANNFVENPKGARSGGMKPRSFVEPAPEKRQQSAKKDDTNPQDRAPGPMTAAEAVTPTQDAGNPIGTGSLGSGQKPFKLGG